MKNLFKHIFLVFFVEEIFFPIQCCRSNWETWLRSVKLFRYVLCLRFHYHKFPRAQEPSGITQGAPSVYDCSYESVYLQKRINFSGFILLVSSASSE